MVGRAVGRSHDDVSCWAQLVALGESSVEELRSIADAWHRWAAHPDGWFLVPHGEIIARV